MPVYLLSRSLATITTDHQTETSYVSTTFTSTAFSTYTGTITATTTVTTATATTKTVTIPSAYDDIYAGYLLISSSDTSWSNYGPYTLLEPNEHVIGFNYPNGASQVYLDSRAGYIEDSGHQNYLQVEVGQANEAQPVIFLNAALTGSGYTPILCQLHSQDQLSCTVGGQSITFAACPSHYQGDIFALFAGSSIGCGAEITLTPSFVPSLPPS